MNAELRSCISNLKSEYVQQRELSSKKMYRVSSKWDKSFEKAAKLCMTLGIDPVEYISEVNKFMTPFAQKIGMDFFAPNMMNSEKFLVWLMKKYLRSRGEAYEVPIEDQIRNQVMTDMCNSEHMFSSCLVSFLKKMLTENRKQITKEEASDVRKAVIMYLADSLSEFWLATDWQSIDMYSDGMFSESIVAKMMKVFDLIKVGSWRILMWEAKQESYRNCSDAISNSDIVDWSKRFLAALVQEDQLPKTLQVGQVEDMKKLEGKMAAIGEKLADENVPLKDRVDILKKVTEEDSSDKS